MKFTAVSFSLSNTPKTIVEWENRLLNDIQKHIDEQAALILYPELFLMELITYFKGDLKQQLEATSSHLINNFAPRVTSLLKGKNVFLCLGSGPRQTEKGIYNSTYVWNNGNLFFQDKMHLTPWETDFIQGEELKIFNFNGIKICTPICFDIEHPGLALKLKEAEIEIILVPYATMNINGSRRVNRCANARAVELGAVVLTAPLVGDFDCDLIDHHEGHQGFFLPAQEAVKVPQETLSDYSTTTTLACSYEIDDQLIKAIKQKADETKPYHKPDNLSLKVIHI